MTTAANGAVQNCRAGALRSSVGVATTAPPRRGWRSDQRAAVRPAASGPPARDRESVPLPHPVTGQRGACRRRCSYPGKPRAHQALSMLGRPRFSVDNCGQNPGETRRNPGQNPSGLNRSFGAIRRGKSGTPGDSASACHAEALGFDISANTTPRPRWRRCAALTSSSGSSPATSGSGTSPTSTTRPDAGSNAASRRQAEVDSGNPRHADHHDDSRFRLLAPVTRNRLVAWLRRRRQRPQAGLRPWAIRTEPRGTAGA